MDEITDKPAGEEPEDPRRVLARLYRKCTPKCRKWLRAMSRHGFEPYGAGAALGNSKHAVFRWLRNPVVRQIMDLRIQQAADEIGFNDLSLLAGYHREERADIRKLFDPMTNQLLPMGQWPDDVARCVVEFGYDQNGLPKVKLADQRGARDRLAKYRKLLVERSEITGADGAPLGRQTIIIGGPGEPDEPADP